MADDPPRPDAPPPSSDPVPAPKDAKTDESSAPRPPPVPETAPDPPADAEARSRSSLLDSVIDMTIFDQILELDDDGTHEFAKEMVTAYFSQASTTFDDMDKALADKKLPELSALGHFLKGSSAALGIRKVQESCEKMQHYGALRDEDADKDLKPAEALDKIKVLLGEVKAEYTDAERWLRNWFKDELKDPFDDKAEAS
ncbi:Histidine-phosphotransfer domain HPT-domain-containing protein [Mycena venus]|uniref:Histidine-phosphotransfer domain HPT-domain-containing protein n=1 Tax=Mycena venus TaxID=2733690 RepID=A0A8H7D8N1_9AGAR|nr:Histidine-phosphotransfer domain HPT-domain-containing protein [Mycena venus]